MRRVTWEIGSRQWRTLFERDEAELALSVLCGQVLGPQNAAGCAQIQADGRTYSGADLSIEMSDQSAGDISATWRVGNSGLRLETCWRGCSTTGTVSRIDRLHNVGTNPLTISRCQTSLVLPSAGHECYTQASRWCRENQGAWYPLHTGLQLRHPAGRTTEESTPYLALRPVGGTSGLVFHILPKGNWTIRVRPITDGGNVPSARVDLGLADMDLHRKLSPGEFLDLPEILFQPLPEGAPRLAAPLLHRYLLSGRLSRCKPEAPVVYNTWFYEFDVLDVPRLRTQLSAAAEIGCEVFVIDAGWYGAGGPDWSAQTGDWREKTEAAFRGSMKDFAIEVRAAGLGFGLWMEPERFGPEAPVRAEHPDWFVPVGEMARIDLSIADAYDWLLAEIARLVETYKLAWMKVDFNFGLGVDPSGEELTGYYSALYSMFDQLRSRYPTTFFEGCASGGLRSDLSSLAAFDGHFLSDTVNPVDVLRISEGAFLRLPPGRINRWAVIRSGGKSAPRYGLSVQDSPEIVLTPRGAVWEPSESINLDFALFAAMPGMMGFSGDLAGFSPGNRARIAEAVTFFKEWRRHITGSVAHLLSEPAPITARDGWSAFQLQDPARLSSLLFVYPIGAAGAPPLFRPRDLIPTTEYIVRRELNSGSKAVNRSGECLMATGIEVDIAAAAIYSIVARVR